MRARTHAGVFTPDRVRGVAFEALGENRNRQSGWIRDRQVHVVGFAVELDQLDIELVADLTDGSVKVSMASVNTPRRYLVTNTRCACSSATLCRLRR